MSYPCTLYTRPNGEQEDILICNIYPETAMFFQEHSVVLSMEELRTLQYAIYARLPNWPEEDEVLVLVRTGECCNDALARLAGQLKSKLQEQLP